MIRSFAAAVVLLVAGLLVTPALAQRDAVSIQQAMDKSISLTVTDATVVDLFKKLTDLTGVHFLLSEETLDYLPYGDQTRLAVKLENVTLRKALTPMLAPQGLQWELQDDLVRIIPTEPLYRMGRRASYEELKLLVALQRENIEPSEKAGQILSQLRKITDDKELKIAFHPTGDREAAFLRAEKVLPATPGQWLDALCQGQNWTWYVSGNEIVILDKLQQINRQLLKRVSLNYQAARLMDVLTDLAHKGRLQLDMEPGVLALLPTDMQNSFNLIMSDASIAQALQVISGVTGLKFTPTSEGIHVDASDSLTKKVESASQPVKKRPPFYVKMALPPVGGIAMELYWTSEELPDDIIEAIQARKPELMHKLRESLGKSLPASMPAAIVEPAPPAALPALPALPEPAPAAPKATSAPAVP